MVTVYLQAIYACLTCAELDESDYGNEKVALLSADNARPVSDIANNVVATILDTHLTGQALQSELNSIVGAYGWSEKLAEWILEKLSRALQEAHDKLGETVRNAYHQAWEAAKSIEGFVIEHPIMSTVIAFGVLVLLAPWVIELLGFGELGPIEGSFAAWWQATYGGLVPKGSLFSYFQRLGMTWLRS